MTIRDAVGVVLTALDKGTPDEIAAMDATLGSLSEAEKGRVMQEVNDALGQYGVCMDARCESE